MCKLWFLCDFRARKSFIVQFSYFDLYFTHKFKMVAVFVHFLKNNLGFLIMCDLSFLGNFSSRNSFIVSSI